MHLCNFFCADINIVVLKRFYSTGIESVAVSFCVLVVVTRTLFFANSDSFLCGTQPV